MSLVGEALGGNKPKLRINRLETETDKNVQGGIEHLVRGLYRAFRNPRSHEKHIDSTEDANCVLMLVTYLLKVIGQAKSPFERSVFLQRVFDEEFVRSDRYAELLASEIPVKYRFDILIEIYRQRAVADEENLAYMLAALWKIVSDESKADFAATVSTDLNTLERAELASMLKLMPSSVWSECQEAARMRIEAMLIGSIREGLYDKQKKKCISGALGTWSSHLVNHALLISEFQDVVADRLFSEDDRAVEYIFKYIFPSLSKAVSDPEWWLVEALDAGLRRGDVRFKEALGFIDIKNRVSNGSGEAEEYRYPKWYGIFGDTLASFVAAEQDDIPF